MSDDAAADGRLALDLSFLEHGKLERRTVRRRRALMVVGIGAMTLLAWVLYVTLSGQWPRVTDRWQVSLTMAFGGFVGGSTPQGSGAIAFPVFTKVLDVPAEVSRSFSLMIQTVGMGSAAVGMLILRRRIEWRAVRIMLPVGAVAFFATMFLFGDRSRPFWPAEVPGAYVRVTFTVLLAAMALVVYLGTRVPLREVRGQLPELHARPMAVLIIGGILGGAITALVGSGADVFLYLVAVVLLGLDPKIGVPTSVVTMAALSMLAFCTIGVIDGQLDVTLSEDRAYVVEVGGQPTVGDPQLDAAGGSTAVFADDGPPLTAGRFDLFGMWLAAIPLVVIGGPLGALAAERMRARTLVTFVFVLAAAEVVSTAIFLDELHENPALLSYSLIALVVSLGGLTMLSRHRHRILGLPTLDPEQTLSRDRLDVSEDFRTFLAHDAQQAQAGTGDENGGPA